MAHPELRVIIPLKNEIEAQLLCLGLLTTLDRLGLSDEKQMQLVDGAEQVFMHDWLAMDETERLEFAARIAITMAGAAAMEQSTEDLQAYIKDVAEKRARARKKALEN
ncbi:MAG: hypothetical protein GY906_07825 [bacterium]|nr:hypothetical protein [bacterium]